MPFVAALLLALVSRIRIQAVSRVVDVVVALVAQAVQVVVGLRAVP